jgi:hypothetical protein
LVAVPETVLVVPGQADRIGTLLDPSRQLDLPTVERVVVTPVLELFANAPTDLEVKAGRHGHIASIEQAVNVASQEEAVARFWRENP